MTKDALLAAITAYYLESRDFNGLPVGRLDIPDEDLMGMLRELIAYGLVSIPVLGPNPHIKMFAAAPARVQIKVLNQITDLTHLTAYPERQHLETVVEHGAYEGRPYTLRMALGAALFEPVFFELIVLETYRNDPRYFYRVTDPSGMLSVTDDYCETGSMKDSDQVLLEHFGFGNDAQMHRVVCVFSTYLSRLTPEHQQIWKAREAEGDFTVHPAHYQSAVLGEFPDEISMFDAFLEELHQLQAMSETAGLPPLVHNAYRDNAPENFTFLIRPTSQELQAFHLTLDKLMSDNLNKKFLKKFVSTESERERKDGKVIVEQKGTVTMLAEWADQFVFEDRAAVDAMLATFREVRKLRQGPAHLINDNTFDIAHYEQQRELMIRAYRAVRTLRLMLALHPALANYDDVPEWLTDCKIYTY